MAALRPASTASRQAFSELMASVEEFLAHDIAAYAVTLNADASWAVVAVRQTSGRIVFVNARERGRAALTDQASFLGESRPMFPAELVVPDVVGCRIMGRWMMLGLSNVGPDTPCRSEPTLEQLVPYLFALRSTSQREIATAAAHAEFVARVSDDPLGLADLLDSVLPHSAEATMVLCPAHGDFVPWNMDLCDDGLHLWDWNRVMPGAPWPYDAIHFAFQSRRDLGKQGRERALHGTMKDLTRLADELRVPSGDDEAWRMLAIYTAYRAANEQRIRLVGSDTEWLVANINDARLGRAR